MSFFATSLRGAELQNLLFLTLEVKEALSSSVALLELLQWQG